MKKPELQSRPLSERLEKNEAGRFLRSLRELSGLTQAQLSGVTGISQRHISFIETGRATPSRSALQKLSQAISEDGSTTVRVLQRFGYSFQHSDESLQEPKLYAAKDAIEFVLNNHDPLPALALGNNGKIVQTNKAGKKLVMLLTGREIAQRAVKNVSFQDLLLRTSGQGEFMASQEILVALIRRLLRTTLTKEQKSRAMHDIRLLKSLLNEHGELILANEPAGHLPVYEAGIRIGDNVAEWRMSWWPFVATDEVNGIEASHLQLLMPSNTEAIEQARELFGF